jgi:hypothetical protein
MQESTAVEKGESGMLTDSAVQEERMMKKS